MGAADRPTTDSDSEIWWSAIQNHALHVNACGDCGRKSLYSRPFCPHCWSEDVTSLVATGRATLYTWSVVHQNAAPFDVRAPYILAMVDLEEGPRLMTVIEQCPAEQLHAGMPLAVAFRSDDDGFVVPVFHPK
ncbi:OB-fold domain-containing protein [Mycobacterium sp. 236(2023)]|uniref:Zn-ribbon domain-containing OB-fold protein n=1 Tax=Mycobacterium sp. 236(2023) TaxID=3038163 RepID=UPI002415468A|nr:OB-fold domain-containing protein [Mycobacterium sp. 236(2023)]MDG4669232.1 OB-fold domain-containing protein [Mycobacterium sp. 236(2023)]